MPRPRRVVSARAVTRGRAGRKEEEKEKRNDQNERSEKEQKIERSEEKEKRSEEKEKRSEKNEPREKRRMLRADVSGLDLDDEAFLTDTAVGSSPSMMSSSPLSVPPLSPSSPNLPVVAVASTPFNVGLFRRGRPTQRRPSSIHSRDDGAPPIRPSRASSRGSVTSVSNSFRVGAFRRRRREPSILGRRGGSEGERSEASEASEGERSEDERNERSEDDKSEEERNEEERNERSEEEREEIKDSTTLSALVMARTRNKKSNNSKKRKSDEGETSLRRSKRRSVASSSVLPSVEVDVDVLPSSVPPADRVSTPDPRYSTPDHTRRPQEELDPAILAPPASSGSSSASPSWPPLRSLATYHGRKQRQRPQTPELEDMDSDISSPPSLTHSPNYPVSKGTKSNAAKAPKPIALTTAALTAMLPQRRTRARRYEADEEEGHDDDIERSALLSEDDDELAYRPQRKKAATVHVQVHTTAANRRQPTRQTRPRQTKAKRTYGSHGVSDKENEVEEEEDHENEENEESSFQPLPDDAFADETTTTTTTTKPKERYFGDELVKAAQKFREVDQWEMSFEQVSRSSSPVGAR